MTNRLQLTIRWVREYCAFFRLEEASERIIARVQLSVDQLSDEEVLDFLHGEDSLQTVRIA